jgi:hypothetical protein
MPQPTRQGRRPSTASAIPSAIRPAKNSTYAAGGDFVDALDEDGSGVRVGRADDDPLDRHARGLLRDLCPDGCQRVVRDRDDVAGDEGRGPEHAVSVTRFEHENGRRDGAGDGGRDAGAHLAGEGDGTVRCEADRGRTGEEFRRVERVERRERAGEKQQPDGARGGARDVWHGSVISSEW